MLAISLAIHAAAGSALLALAKGSPKDTDAPPPPAAAGETFEVPEVDRASSNEPADEPARAPAGSHPAAVHVHREPDAPRGAVKMGPSAEATAGGEGKSAVFGAVGERGVSDLATAFTRGFPQAASADPTWTHAPLGPAGSADVSLEIDESGQLIDTQVTGSPSPALREGIRRTIILIRSRQFVSTAAVTRLHVVGTVSADTVHDDLHGEVFAIGGSFSGHEGNAFFALAIGRRIDLSITRR